MISLLAASLMLSTDKASADDRISLQRPECPVELERRTVEPDVLVVRSDCALPLPALADALGKGLAMLFPDHKPDIRTIYVGRLLDYPDWSAALAKAAAASPAWDARHGHPRNRQENDNFRVAQLLNGPAFPSELAPVLAHYGLKACIPYVEKVLIDKAQTIFQPWATAPKSIKKSARLPIDAQVWLSLHPLGSECWRH